MRLSLFGPSALRIVFPRSGVFGANTQPAPTSFTLLRFWALRDNATSVSFMDFASNNAATPTPPEAPVTRHRDPAGGGAAGSLHWASACQAVKNTKGAAAISSIDQPGGRRAMLSAGTTTFSANVPQT